MEVETLRNKTTELKIRISVWLSPWKISVLKSNWKDHFASTGSIRNCIQLLTSIMALSPRLHHKSIGLKTDSCKSKDVKEHKNVLLRI